VHVTSIRCVAIACLGLLGACASNGGTAVHTEGSRRFRDLATVVMSDTGEGRPIPGMAYIRYPDEERRRNIEASFAFAFLLDATGHVEYESISFLNGAPPAFFDEACLWLRSMRFVPVQRDGTPRRSLVVSDLTFTLDFSRGPGSALSVRRATRVNAERYRRELAALGVERSVQKLEAHRHCP
jgi:hypothetical protein